MGAGSEPPSGARVVHHGMDELLVQQGPIHDRETATPVQKRTQHSQSLGRFLSNLVEIRRRVQPSSPDIELCRPTGLSPRTAVLVGAGGNAFRPSRKSSQSSSRLRWRLSILSPTALDGWGMLPCSWWPAAACGTWLWWPYRPRRRLTRGGTRVKTYQEHTD